MPVWILSTKFWLTLGSLLGVFYLVYEGKDVRQLEIIVPAILAFYQAGNVIQDVARRKYGNGTDDSVIIADSGGK